MRSTFYRFLAVWAALLATLAPTFVHADPADVAAAARGVVRVVIVGSDGEEIFPVSHGTGFAVSREKIVTNAHVVDELRNDDRLRIGIVPSEGGEAVFGKVIAFSPRNDLALIETNSPLRLPPLTIAGASNGDTGEVNAVGYPMNVDRAQGLEMGDIFKAQPPVKSRGFLSGKRPSRQFDTILHTAPIARGNSGGPLLDTCGRVVGVNSFGADSSGADAEFFFAVSTRELLPFLRENDVTPRVNAMPCRSLAELDAEEAARSEREQRLAAQRAASERERMADEEAIARRNAELAILDERDNGMALAALGLLLALGGGLFAFQAKAKDQQKPALIGAAIAGLGLIGALYAWFSRPGMDEIDARTDELLAGVEASDPGEQPQIAGGGNLVCTVEPSRSRITTASSDDIPLDWSEDGCVNGRTQYGLSSDGWTRVFVPNDEAVVSVNRYDPERREYRMERYLLGRTAMEQARSARGEYKAPQCGGGEADARQLGDAQQGIIAALPPRPNERIVYSCREGTGSGEEL